MVLRRIMETMGMVPQEQMVSPLPQVHIPLVLLFTVLYGRVIIHTDKVLQEWLPVRRVLAIMAWHLQVWELPACLLEWYHLV